MERNRWEVALPRSRPAASFARHLLVDWASRWLSHGTLADIECAVGEALANTAEHGGATVRLRCWNDGQRIVVEVAGQHRGTGYLGARVMHALADEIEFLDGGRKVRLSKRLCDDDWTYRKNVRRQDRRRTLQLITQALPRLGLRLLHRSS
jgi:anti-sigma regulatory factor (Ser/Thr protein kinase)